MLNFDFSKIRGQCYDKAASMAGEKSGVKTQIIEDNEKALYIHCFNHGLNLAVMDTLSKIQMFKDSLSYSEELLKLFKKSPKRESLFRNMKESDFDVKIGMVFRCFFSIWKRGMEAGKKTIAVDGNMMVIVC